MAELVATGTASSVVSSIITFGDVGWRILKRVNEFVNDTEDVPEVLADIKAQLPLLIEKMDRLKSLGEERLQEIDPQSALAEAVTGCRSHIDRLENLVNKLQPQVRDSRTKKMKKAGQSMFCEEISKILSKLEGYKTSFILHFTDISIDLDTVTEKDELYYMVPYLQVSDYVERIDLLESVKLAVQQRREQQQRQVVVLLGMGGQGKSQLAMEYCRTARLSKEFWAIFWIDASSIKSTHRSFERIASKTADPSRIFENIEEKVAFVKDTMDSWDSRWLLVFDNYDAPSTDFNVAAFFPSSPSGTILVTSRHEDSKRLGKVIPLAKMTEQESLLLLLRRSENALTDETMATGKSIVAKLGFLPLAIDLAGALISEQKLPLTQFLERFDLQKEEIVKFTHSLKEYKQILRDDVKETTLNVFTTWELSFQQIQKGETGVRLRSFLTTAAFFNTQNIGEDLFRSANDLEAVPLWIDAFVSEGKWDSVKYRKVLAELSKLSLLNFALEPTKGCQFYLHPLIADWLRLQVGPEIRQLCTIESSYLLAKLIESTDLEFCSYAFHQYLLEHVDKCLNNKRTYSKPIDEDAGFAKIVIAQFGRLPREMSRYREGISLVEEELSIIESAYGKDHESTLDIVYSLGVLYFDQGELARAEEIYKRALAGQEKALGKDHASTLTTLNDLGLLYLKQGKMAEAKEMFKCALVEGERALGKDHASTLNTINNLGILYFAQEKLVEAKEMYQHALVDKEKALGKDHVSTLTTLNNLGALYSAAQRKLAEAEEMYKCAFAMYKHALVRKKKALGKAHASTLNTANYRGRSYSAQRKFVEAEEIRAKKGKTLWTGHASTLNTDNNLGLLSSTQGKLVEAEQMYKCALGKDHVSTLNWRPKNKSSRSSSKVGEYIVQIANKAQQEARAWVEDDEPIELHEQSRSFRRREIVSEPINNMKRRDWDIDEDLRLELDEEGVIENDPGRVVETALCRSKASFVEDFIRVVNEGSGDGYFVSSKWLLSLAEHERDSLMLCLRTAGYSETFQTSTTVLFTRTENHTPRKSAKEFVCPDDIIHEVAAQDGDDDLLQIAREGLNTEKNVAIADVVVFNNRVETSSSIDLGRKSVNNFPAQQQATVLKSFKAIIKTKTHQSFCVSTTWLSNFEDHEKETLLTLLREAGYEKTSQTKSASWYTRIQGCSGNQAGGACDTDISSSSISNEADGQVKQSTISKLLRFFSQMLKVDPKDDASGSSNVAVTMETNKIKDDNSTCHAQVLTVACLSSAGRSRGELYQDGDFYRQKFGASVVKWPVSKSEVISSTIEQSFAIPTLDFLTDQGGTEVPTVAPVTLQVVVAISLSCCLRIAQHPGKIRMKFSIISAEIRNNEAEEENQEAQGDLQEEFWKSLVLSYLCTNVYSCIKGANDGRGVHQIVLHLEDEYNSSPGIRKMADDQHSWLEKSGIKPRNSDPGSTSLLLRRDVGKSDVGKNGRRDSGIPYCLHFQEFRPVIFEGNIDGSITLESFLEFRIRQMVEISYFGPSGPIREDSQAVWFATNAKKRIDFPCCLELRTDNLSVG